MWAKLLASLNPLVSKRSNNSSVLQATTNASFGISRRLLSPYTGCRFKWTPKCQRSFEELKYKLTTAPVLAYPDFSKPFQQATRITAKRKNQEKNEKNRGTVIFILNTEASDFGTGGVLSQKGNDGEEHIVSYASRSVSKAERRYCVTRRELLAVVVFTQHFRPYLLS